MKWGYGHTQSAKQLGFACLGNIIKGYGHENTNDNTRGTTSFTCAKQRNTNSCTGDTARCGYGFGQQQW